MVQDGQAPPRWQGALAPGVQALRQVQGEEDPQVHEGPGQAVGETPEEGVPAGAQRGFARSLMIGQLFCSKYS